MRDNFSFIIGCFFGIIMLIFIVFFAAVSTDTSEAASPNTYFEQISVDQFSNYKVITLYNKKTGILYSCTIRIVEGGIGNLTMLVDAEGNPLRVEGFSVGE